MKRRFEKRQLRRHAELTRRDFHRQRDRHDRAWLVGAGGVIGHWKIVSGLWKEENSKLVCVASGVATGPYTKDLPAGHSTFHPLAFEREPLRLYTGELPWPAKP